MLLTFFTWIQHSALAQAIQESRWSMPIFLIFHALGMTLLIGTIIIVSLRLLGLMMSNRPVPEIAGEVRRWSIAGLIVMLASGLLLFIPEPLRWYQNGSFQLKMAFLLLAILFHFTVYRKVTQASTVRPIVYRLCGVAALILWYGVGWGGRLLTLE